MGFTRSTEGRVFFQTLAEENAEQQQKNGPITGAAPSASVPSTSVSSQTSSAAPSPQAKKDATQLQILTLLKALNARLQASQKDKETLQNEIESAKKQLEAMQSRANAQEAKAFQLEKALAEKGAGSPEEVKRAEEIAAEAMKELSETRKLLLDVESRAGKSEEAIKKQERTLRESEERLVQYSAKLERKAAAESKELDKRIKAAEEAAQHIEKELQKRLTKTEEIQNLIDKRLDDVLLSNDRLDKKIDKAIQDRTRLIRKLERLEESVLQNTDALSNQKPLLLTDKTDTDGAMAAVDVMPKLKSLDLKMDEDASSPWWQRRWRIDAFSAGTAIVVVLLLGWGINELQRPGQSEFDAAEWGQQLSTVDVKKSGEEDAATFEPQGLNVDNQSTLQQPDRSFVEKLLEGDVEQSIDDAPVESVEPPQKLQDNTQTADRTLPVRSSEVNIKDDLGMVDVNDPDELEKLLAEDPDKLAAVLNTIEPGAATPEGDNASDLQASLAQSMKPSQLSQADLATPEAFELPPAPTKPLKQRISFDRNLPKEIAKIQDEAFAGSGTAQHDLAAIYTAGHGGVKQNYQKAAQWFEAAAYNGIANAQYNLGVMYHQGIGMEKNIETAFRWYHAAAAQGHAEAQYNLGIAYIEGIGVPYDPLRAAGYFERSARSGVMEAAYNLGLIYENGLLGDAQPDKALMWYKTAADKGSPEAKAALEMLAKNLGVSLDDVNRIAENMRKIENGQAPASAQVQNGAPAPVEAPVEKSIIPPMDDTTYLIAEIQKQLMTRGLYPGPADGVNGMLTRDAIRSYQARRGLEVNGEVSDDLLTDMISDSGSEGVSR